MRVAGHSGAVAVRVRRPACTWFDAGAVQPGPVRHPPVAGVVLWAGPARAVSLAFMAGLHGRVHLRRCGGETVLTHKLGALPWEAGGLLRATGGACNPGRGSIWARSLRLVPDLT